MRQRRIWMTTAIFGATAAVAGQPRQGVRARPATAIPVLTWNVSQHSVFPKDGETVDVTAATWPVRFARVLRALRPDVIGLQEVTERGARSASRVTHILPPGRRDVAGPWRGGHRHPIPTHARHARRP
jgi:hypothetical protein